MREFVLLILAVVLLVGCTQQYPTGNSSSQGGVSLPNGSSQYTQGTPSTGPSQGSSGRAVFTVSDNAVNMGTISAINVTVDSVLIHSNTGGWVTVSSTPQTFDLLQLQASGVQALLADVNLTNGTYDQVRSEISNVIVTDSSGDHNATLPSGDLKINGPFDIKSNSTSAISFDFVASDSVHMTGDGKYLLAPVVHIQSTEDANVSVNNGTVAVSGGNLDLDSLVGMNENGTVGYGVQIPTDANVSIDEHGAIKIGGSNGIGNDGSHGNGHGSSD